MLSSNRRSHHEARPHDRVSMMTSQEILEWITGIGIVPIVRVASAQSAVQAVEAIYQGGVRAAEIAMTVPGAIRALEQVADRLGDRMMLGAGTVLDPETARACMPVSYTHLRAHETRHDL